MADSKQVLDTPHYADEIDVRDLLRIFWLGKWLIAGIALASALIAAIVALLLPNVYQAEALLASNSGEGRNGLSALSAQYGGLASLAGISIGADTTDKTALGLEILKSRKFVSDFVSRHELLVPLFAATDWDSETDELEIDPDIFDTTSGKWVRKAKPPRKTVPSPQEAHERFMEIMSVVQDKKTGLVSVSVRHYSPHIAKRWVDLLVQDLNASTMRHDIAEAELAIEYLNGQIENTSLADLQAVFFNLIEEQTKTVMLARITPEYLLRTVDPAVVPERRVSPNRKIIVALGLLLGGVLGMVAVFLRKNYVAGRGE